MPSKGINGQALLARATRVVGGLEVSEPNVKLLTLMDLQAHTVLSGLQLRTDTEAASHWFAQDATGDRRPSDCDPRSSVAK